MVLLWLFLCGDFGVFVFGNGSAKGPSPTSHHICLSLFLSRNLEEIHSCFVGNGICLVVFLKNLIDW